MPKYKLLHEAPAPSDKLAQKYNVPTYEEYKTLARSQSNPDVEHSPLQELAFSYIIICGTVGKEPKVAILGPSLIRRFMEAEIEIPRKFETCDVTYDLDQPMRVSYIL